ncbi:hypothetical protein K474DRAFT_655010 [Panus rudis PR-1116 ss-1]|nr:hypothetical protein K474DRAFT_655010 [Panus rudis PR-1116 ss-1]
MAQPVFDDHPLEEYFRQTGETPEEMPGGSTEFRAEDISPSSASESIQHRLPDPIVRLLSAVNTLLSSSAFCQTDNSFAERFKYDVISSSLLSSSIAAPPSATRLQFAPDLPTSSQQPSGSNSISGDESSDHSRSSSITTEDSQTRKPSGLYPDAAGLQWPSVVASLAVLALSAEYYFTALFFILAAIYMVATARAQASKAESINQTVNALNELISAGNVWDSAVNEAMTIVETEDQSPSSSKAPLSSLRIALQSSFHTTQNQCDNVRQLLSALTSPSDLAQLSEMYAPASPKPAFLPLESLHTRPVSDPVSALRRRVSSLPGEVTMNKRATWNGSYYSLAQQSFGRKQKRRSDLSNIFSSPERLRSSLSAPTSPQPKKPLADVQEETTDTEGEYEDAADELKELKGSGGGYFGMAALEMHRKRRSAGMEAFVLSPPPKYSTQPHQPPPSTTATFSPPPRLGGRGRRASVSSPSKFTLPQTTRHPLSLSALRLALQGALAAKRYACSHLLALRFDEEEDDAYWEDVRSIMALLTSTFSDASSRLMEALDETEKKRIKDERPTSDEEESPDHHQKSSSGKKLSSLLTGFPKMRTMTEMTSFAPMPSHLSRFAAHVDAISSALNDAREHLEECVAAIRQSPEQVPSTSVTAEEHAAMQAYDRLRKELGYALRECERGRERLLDIISPPPPPPVPSPSADQEELPSVVPPTPPLVNDSASSEDTDSALLTQPAVLSSGHGLGLEGVMQAIDDASDHLLLSTSSTHLPPPGIEQVYEADSGVVGTFTREKSKLSREERIKLAKARRESGRASLDLAKRGGGDDEAEGGLKREKWGPGGEVVQELKDVIWKVGEKKRKLSEQVKVLPVPVPVLPASDLPSADTTSGPVEIIPTADHTTIPLSRTTPISVLPPPPPPIVDDDDDDDIRLPYLPPPPHLPSQDIDVLESS